MNRWKGMQLCRIQQETQGGAKPDYVGPQNQPRESVKESSRDYVL